jgi:esterase/lipase superfamily enzyme
MRIVIMLVLLGAMLAGCGTRPSDAVLLPAKVSVKPWREVTIYAVTTRSPSEDGVGYGSGKAEKTRYLRYIISIPQSHTPGEIEYPGPTAGPDKSFTVIAAEHVDHAEFLQAVGRQKQSGKQIGVFVHGFNYSFQESLFRMAQMSADADVDGMAVLFAWPSLAEISGYIGDKDAAAYSRDQLTGLLTDLGRFGGKDTLVLGHSMGGWLTMEALRQMRLTGKGREMNRLQVVLAAPDIDLDLFRAQLEVVGRMKNPLVVLVSPDDRALKLSSLLAGDKRAGALDIRDPSIQEEAREANVAIVDISELSSADGTNHDRFTALAALYPKLKADGRPNEVQRAGVFVFSTIGNTISAPFRLASSAFSQGPR